MWFSELVAYRGALVPLDCEKWYEVIGHLDQVTFHVSANASFAYKDVEETCADHLTCAQKSVEVTDVNVKLNGIDERNGNLELVHQGGKVEEAVVVSTSWP